MKPDLDLLAKRTIIEGLRLPKLIEIWFLDHLYLTEDEIHVGISIVRHSLFPNIKFVDILTVIPQLTKEDYDRAIALLNLMKTKLRIMEVHMSPEEQSELVELAIRAGALDATVEERKAFLDKVEILPWTDFMALLKVLLDQNTDVAEIFKNGGENEPAE